MAQRPDLPAAVKCYFDAVAAKDLDGLVGCFAPEAVIVDVSRRIVGRNAIRRWARDEVIGGVYRLLEVASRKDGVSILLTFAPPPGTGTGFRARYAVAIKGGKIIHMDLQYA